MSIITSIMYFGYLLKKGGPGGLATISYLATSSPAVVQSGPV